MSDTYRKSDPDALWYNTKYKSPWRTFWEARYPEKAAARMAREKRDEALLLKGADGHNARGVSRYRFMRPRKDATGKLDRYTEVGAGRRNNRDKKRQASKLTRQYAKRILDKDLKAP